MWGRRGKQGSSFRTGSGCRQVSIKSRISLVLIALFVLALGALKYVEHSVLIPQFEDLERDEAARDIARCRQAIDRELEHLDLQCREWASWESTQQFFRDLNGRFVAEHLSTFALQNSNLDLIAFLDWRGQTLWSRVVDPEGAAWSGPQCPFFGAGGELRTVMRTSLHGALGVVPTSAAPVMVALRPVNPVGRGASAGGALVMGRFLTDPEISRIAERTRVRLDLLPIEEMTPDRGLARLAAGLASLNIAFDEHEPAMLRVACTYPDAAGAPTFALLIDVPRALLARGQAALRFASVYMIVAAMALLACLWLALHRLVVSPVARLTNNVTLIAESHDLSRRINMRRGDELGILAREFDRMMHRLDAVHRRLRYTALHDPLTGLPNRAYIIDRLERCMERTRRRRDYIFGLLFIDLDGFKSVNDTHGHETGDRLLQAVAQRLRLILRASDLVGRDDNRAVARLGGDEFIILLEEIASIEDTQVVAERARSAMTEPIAVMGRLLQVGCSVGVVCSADYATADDMLRAADEAMYRVKLERRALAEANAAR
ncbi:MAG: diguanylate cyclase [Planctomycetota bacterium]|nr:MAG: diguanylate cyclase [Planctomycetota bacterium]KAB2946119.1 MAG: diguanylate cyclase [Phycisphaerae bacterium]MCQ3919722.1 hypothetical protein [Planctomycetota bacterium]